jgi:CRP-like cAMP-binding protein
MKRSTAVSWTTQRRPTPENLLLAALPAAERRRLLSRCERVALVAGDTLTEPSKRIRHVFFPTDGFVSLIAPIDQRAQLEVGLVGNEGMLGVSLILGVQTSPVRALVLGGGSAWRLDIANFSDARERSPALERGLGRYLYALLSQIAQTAACGRFHQVDARLARWLLMTRDRAHSSRFHITHELLAHMLGVRREGVTQAATALRQRNVIRYRRGDLEILDVRRLEATACSCYAFAKETYARLLR